MKEKMNYTIDRCKHYTTVPGKAWYCCKEDNIFLNQSGEFVESINWPECSKNFMFETEKEIKDLLNQKSKETKMEFKTGDIVFYGNQSAIILLGTSQGDICVGHDDYFPLQYKEREGRKQIGYNRVIDKVIRPMTNCDYSKFVRRKDINEYITVWQKPVTHNIIIEGKTIEISEESFQNLKKQLMES